MVQSISPATAVNGVSVNSYYEANSPSRIDFTELFIRCAVTANQANQMNRKYANELRVRHFEELTSGASNLKWTAFSGAGLGALGALFSGYSIFSGNTSTTSITGWSTGSNLANSLGQPVSAYFNKNKSVSDANAQVVQQHNQLANEAASKSQQSLDRFYSDHQKLQEMQQAAARAMMGR
jgi:hypothetical protein